jgi:hypothetical protein
MPSEAHIAILRDQDGVLYALDADMLAAARVPEEQRATVQTIIEQAHGDVAGYFWKPDPPKPDDPKPKLELLLFAPAGFLNVGNPAMLPSSLSGEFGGLPARDIGRF